MVGAAVDTGNETMDEAAAIKLQVQDLAIHYGSFTAISGVNLEIRENEIFGIIGPANSGKTSFLKALNRMDQFNAGMTVTGETAPIMFTGAAFFLPFLPESVFDQTMALSLHLFVVSTQVPGVPDHLPYGVALVLIAMVLAMNALSIGFRMHLRSKKKW